MRLNLTSLWRSYRIVTHLLMLLWGICITRGRLAFTIRLSWAIPTVNSWSISQKTPSFASKCSEIILVRKESLLMRVLRALRVVALRLLSRTSASDWKYCFGTLSRPKVLSRSTKLWHCGSFFIWSSKVHDNDRGLGQLWILGPLLD